MKITKSKLKEMIREEIQKLSEKNPDDEHEEKMHALNPKMNDGKVRPALIKIAKDISSISKKAKGDLEKVEKDIGSYLKGKGFNDRDGFDNYWPMKGAHWFVDDPEEGGYLVDMTVSMQTSIDIETGKVIGKWTNVFGGTYMPHRSSPTGWEL